MGNGLYERVREVAEREHTTMRNLVEEGLHAVLPKHEHREGFAFKPVTVKGSGLSEEFKGADWAAIRRETYEGRGT